MIWKIWKKGKLNSDKIWKIQNVTCFSSTWRYKASQFSIFHNST
jgi:hypothetical protein